MTNVNGENVNDCWEQIKSCLHNACGKNCGWTKGAPRCNEIWWWDDRVNAIKLKCKLWKEWKEDMKSKEEYLVAKRRAKSATYFAKKSENDKKFRDLNSTEQSNLIFKIACKMKRNNKNIIKEKCVKDQEGSMAFNYNSNAKTWQTNYSNQLNVEFPWNHDSLSNKPPVHSPPIFITDKMICKTISQMKNRKATGPSDVALEMILASQQHI